MSKSKNTRRECAYVLRNLDFKFSPCFCSLANLCEIMMHPIDVSETKLAIVNDPNGLEIRLMELTDAQLNEVSSKKNVRVCKNYYYVLLNAISPLPVT